MARIRTIKPEFFANEELGQCSPHARLLAIALLQMADSEGRLRYIPSQILAHAFPWEALDLSPLLHELFTIAYARKYCVSGREYLDIPTFCKHQRLTGKEASSKSKYPSWDQRDTEGKQRGKTQRFPGKHLDAQEQGTGNREQDSLVGQAKKSAKSGKKSTSLAARSRAILEFLNATAERSFQPVDANLDLIKSRLREADKAGVTDQDFKCVIANRCAKWKGDDRMAEYLRPATLFAKSNFWQYHGLLVEPSPESDTTAPPEEIVDESGSQGLSEGAEILELPNLQPTYGRDG